MTYSVFTTEEIQEVKDGFLEQEIAVYKIDWDASSNDQRITHLFRMFSYIKYYRSKLPNGLIRDYQLSDFFTNLYGTADVVLTANIDTKSDGKKILGDPNFMVESIGLQINQLYEVKTFYPVGNVKESKYNTTHLFFPKTGSDEWGFSIIDFIVPNTEWEVFNSKLNY